MGLGEEIWAANGRLTRQPMVNRDTMISYEYIPKGICSSLIKVFIDDENDTVKSVAILGGCHGNLTAIMRLLKGKSI